MSQLAESKRERFVSELRRLADIFEQHPELPLPYHSPAVVLLASGNTENLAEFARIVGRADKDVTEYSFRLIASGFETVQFFMSAAREFVCERVVVDRQTVTREVPDPDAMASVPLVEVTEEVEVVEWVCPDSILRPVEGVA